MSYGAIISVYIGPDDTITALTDYGIDELKDMLRDARITPGTPSSMTQNSSSASRPSHRGSNRSVTKFYVQAPVKTGITQGYGAALTK